MEGTGRNEEDMAEEMVRGNFEGRPSSPGEDHSFRLRRIFLSSVREYGLLIPDPPWVDVLEMRGGGRLSNLLRRLKGKEVIGFIRVVGWVAVCKS